MRNIDRKLITRLTGKIGLVVSKDGINWEKARNYRIMSKKIRLQDGSEFVPDRLERPFVYVEDNKLEVLCLATKKVMTLSPFLFH
ncbi:hypothetical protein QQ008_12830 [Fulvivirgaceae bacterium BMA10]|uniref:Uncharacterized protein n=1 Tax=Splendidivirga corallicola TaxID=3051826 RepID=A0ABT8KQI0_9BACT|nr:hypothetical protein [Fulvivirgaceae bacterium BMA10]